MSLELIAKADEAARHKGDTESLLWHDGHVISSGDGGKVKIWTPDLKLITEFQAHDYPIYHTASDGQNFYTCSNDATIKEWTQKDGQWVLVRTIEGHQGPIRRLRVNGGRLFAGDETGHVRIWKDGKQEAALNVLEEVWDMFAEGEKLYTVRDRDVTISSLSAGNNLATTTTLEGRGPLRVSGNKLVFVDRNGMDVLVYDNEAPGHPLLGKLQGHSMIINAIIGDPDKFFTAGWDKKVVAWDLNKLEKITELPLNGYVNTMAMSSIGNLYVGGENGGIEAIKINF